MQTYTPRPTPQPIRRQAGSYYAGPDRAMRVPVRDFATPPALANSALDRNFGSSALPQFHPERYTPPSTYANSTQALFAASQPHETPYQQQYHLPRPTRHKEIHFPFRAFMIVLVVGAVAFGAFAIYRAFTQSPPVIAEPTEELYLTP